MKKIKLLLAVVMLAASCSAVAQCRTIAIPEIVDKTRGLAPAVKAMLRNSFAEAVNSIPGYASYDRTSDIDAILDEHMFQQSGLVSESSRKELRMTGAKYLLLAEASVYEGKLFVTAKIVDVETARIVGKPQDIFMYNHPMGIKQGCTALARRLLGIAR
ncbi:MAG: hypothetical protein E7130_02985 [Rikenellaceae bacterium]|nr:hypothetical protein [Rikenellaceae bacterium]MBQ3259923.1 hypothetical protein [Alistipes sp.]MBQ7341939.1 hypothetical protein [Alistipes sp.]